MTVDKNQDQKISKPLRSAILGLMHGVLLVGWLSGCVNVAKASQPAMWVIKDNDSTIYLFGTVHMLKKDVVWNTPRVQKAMADSKELWLEIIDMEMNNQTRMAALIQKYALDPQRPLSTRLNAAQKTKLTRVASEYGVPVQNLELMKPWFVGLIFAMLPLQKAGYDPNAGVDRLLKAQAEKEGDTLKAFETTEQQLGFFDSLPEDLQIAFLEEALDTAEEGLGLMQQLTEAYIKGDMNTIARILNDEMKTKAPQLYDLLLTKRNQDWAAQIETLMQGAGTHFIAVGAGHLAGADSLQVQLEKRGIKAQRL